MNILRIITIFLLAATPSLAQDDFRRSRPVKEVMNFDSLAALGGIYSTATWNKFGYNEDLNNSTYEVLAEFGGAFNQRLTNAETLDVASSSTSDDVGGTGVTALVIFGVGGTSASDRNLITDVVTMDGTTTVTTNLLFWGVNRMTIFQSGSGTSNVGAITATATTSGNIMATMPAGQGTTQQGIFYIPDGYTFLASWLRISAIKSSGGGNPAVEFRGYVYSEVVNSQFEVYRDTLDTSSEQHMPLAPPGPFVIGENSILWFEALSSAASGTNARIRFSGKLIKNINE